MSGGGIIINRSKVLLVAITDPCLYQYLSPHAKAKVDAIDAKDPASRTEKDVRDLAKFIQDSVNS